MIIYLIGFAGTGKYTIAKKICQLTGARLVDNHLINNPVFSVIHQDGGKTPLPETVWEKTWAIRDIVLETILTISPPDFSFVFTNDLVEGWPDDLILFSEVEGLASKRGSLFIPVRLLCSEDELCSRIVSPDRAERFKDINPLNAQEKSRTHSVLKVAHPNTLDLDVTQCSAQKAAERIIAHIKTVIM